ncbi:F-box/LRR-repeat protein 2-like isoform X2 [Varroa destructor]|uniref:F-box domain-containing protein n=1 Tax=Varroa destructor TaxID=109461 RepID=A0A7M7JIS3_VARDE|nr:F-box/LRR-repeat protein 2-like isoform X2 [Varroa destructor]
MASVEDLPDELLEKLLLYLRPGDRLNCASVCQRWNVILCGSRMVEDVRLVIAEGGLQRAMEALQESSRAYPSLRIVNGTLYDFNGSFWERVGESLIELHLDDCDLSALVFYAILRACQNLKSLEITGCSSLMMSDSLLRPLENVSREKVQESLRGVRHLSLKSNRYLTDASFHCLLELMPHLTSLSLAGCTILQFHPAVFKRFHTEAIEFSTTVVTFQNVLACMMKCKSLFTALDFSQTPINAKAMAYLGELYRDHLVELRLNRCDQLTNNAFLSIAECQKLRVLSLASTCQANDAHLEAILKKTVDLEHLDLQGCYRIGDSACHAISGLRRLRYLSLYSCAAISNEALSSLQNNHTLRHLDLSYTKCDVTVFQSLTALTQLRVLKLANCRRLDDECLQLICDNLRKLEVLNLDYCLTFTDAGVSQIHKLSGLRELTLTGAVDITDRSLNRGLGSLDMRLLQLCLASQLTDAALVSIATHHRSLELIDLSGCPQITDVGLISLIQGVPRLRTLLLKGCRSLTDRSLHVLLSHCPVLRRLLVEHCSMSEDAINLFAHLRPTVDVN